ncbi:MAG: hypothetical protein ACH37Z_06580 [Anaerolineae bacterium]|nr:hypothetical protein [Ardenticatenia bacterium]HQZ70123.1 hypothetical protein [Anaerolineae bacterium]
MDLMDPTKPSIHVPPGGPPRVPAPSAEIYAGMGEAGVRAMIAALYDELHRSSIAQLFSPDIDRSVERSTAFFVGLLGGPPLYHQRYGPPAMRARHLPVAIDEAARQEWLACFRRVLVDAPRRFGFPAEHLPGFDRFLDGFAGWMVNRASPDDEAPREQLNTL